MAVKTARQSFAEAALRDPVLLNSDWARYILGEDEIESIRRQTRRTIHKAKRNYKPLIILGLILFGVWWLLKTKAGFISFVMFPVFAVITILLIALHPLAALWVWGWVFFVFWVIKR